MIFPVYEIYKAAETAAITAQLNLSRSRLEMAVDNAINFYESSRLWRANTIVRPLVPQVPVGVSGTYSHSQRKLTLSSGTWPQWASGQLVLAAGAFQLGEVHGQDAEVRITSATSDREFDGLLLQNRFKLPDAINIRMVAVEGLDKPLAAINELQFASAVARCYSPRPPYFYLWDPAARELLVLPQAPGVVLQVAESVSCRQGKASGAAEEDHYGLVTASGDIVIGDGTQFTIGRHEDCVIYISGDLAVPDTSLTWARIVEVLSPTELKIDRALTVNSPSEFRITGTVRTSNAGFEMIKQAAVLDVAAITGKGFDAAKAAFEASFRRAIREESSAVGGTVLDPGRIPEWIQRSPGAL